VDGFGGDHGNFRLAVFAPTTTTTTTLAPTTTTTTTTTSTSSTTTTCPPPAQPCTCTGGTPSQLVLRTTVGSGSCGHLDTDGNPDFFPLACGGLYFGGAGVGIPLPVTFPNESRTVMNVCCDGTAL